VSLLIAHINVDRTKRPLRPQQSNPIRPKHAELPSNQLKSASAMACAELP
jgi:hypothetical protein